ncbi:MAG: hypothetical protein KDJ49_01575 [Alphaproteobacteria bacterium]|nr:hypothetical protein [Alphaproteobacteria bacterium]USO07999.1 MAG: hypothetical protein H6866_01915 [Rhodospirillales bacterium]
MTNPKTAAEKTDWLQRKFGGCVITSEIEKGWFSSRIDGVSVVGLMTYNAEQTSSTRDGSIEHLFDFIAHHGRHAHIVFDQGRQRVVVNPETLELKPYAMPVAAPA